ncbi:hypothetical protein C0V72_00500 [Porphyrobacter sp. TH134]|uniref:GGDEF domain-containing protein n=1 Tax=Porphyrobacter sp. TH134 TaxID=2067450 RepID=UPI000C7E464A|nr:diguanylate cyclase [Porphyrobacter sp. TH134]PLK28067.1 hypothetical protein C0V72_00500 [Porphyrobacter sp. TH134]
MTGIELPLEVAGLLCASFALLGAWTGRSQTIRRFDPQRKARQGAGRGPAVSLGLRGGLGRGASHAVLEGRIDQLAALRTIWSVETSDEVREHVIAVMRAGLRHGDRMTLAGGEAFTIVLPGADERTAVRIADRLRRTLARLNLPQLGGQAHLTASFGVAAERFGETGDTLVRRARRALDAAVAKGADHIVPASEIEEIMLLPAPAPIPSIMPAASAA